MKVEKSEYYSIWDLSLIEVMGSGETEEEAIEHYKVKLQDYKSEVLSKLKTIEKIEKEIEDIEIR